MDDGSSFQRGRRSMKIGIIGFGKMGLAIFSLLAGKTHEVTVLVKDKAKKKDGETKCLKLLKRSLRRKAITESEFQKKTESLKFTCKVEDLASAEVVIETICEDYQEKESILSRLESVVSRTAVLVTNTSSISIEQLAKVLTYKDRFCGLHFFHPLMFINLVEIIRYADTPDELLNFLLDFCEDMGKQAIVVYDSPGSMINLILAHYYIESLYILEEGIALPSKIDTLAKKFSYIGPCESLDVIGIDLFIEILTNIMGWPLNSHSQPYEKTIDVGNGHHIPYLFHQLISRKRFGKNTSKGIYLYGRGRPIDDAPEFYAHPAHEPFSVDSNKLDKLIENRLLYSVFNGCIYSFQKGLSSLEEADFGVKEILVMKNGPFNMMTRIGKHQLKENFDFLAQNVGERFRQENFDFLED
jgi:3-hydroxyacyl-CoA dehydrogenase